DEFVRGNEALTVQERDGLRLFEDPAKGGCVGCHTMTTANRDPTTSLFTDYGYDAVGPPKNERAPARAKPDLGLCERTSSTNPTNEPRSCANNRPPSLRTGAGRESFMHNGASTKLRDVVAFYASRDTNPRRWYPRGVKFDDVPKEHRGQVNTTIPPYN